MNSRMEYLFTFTTLPMMTPYKSSIVTVTVTVGKTLL